MKIYVAAKWEDRPRAREVMGQLIAAGHVITHDWTWVDQVTTLQAALDKRGVMDAETLVFVAEQDLRYTGALVELGIAIGRGIPCYIIGPAIDHCIFLHLPQIHRGIETLLSPTLV